VRPALEVADIFRRHGEAYRHAHGAGMGRVERRVMSAIATCRTAALGGHVEQCTGCRAIRVSYNSCRNRHCPKCQGLARAEWLEARQAELLPVPYFHVVFTVPAPIAEIAFQNKAMVYDMLFQATAETLRTIAADPEHLGAEIGMLAVLHTWGQNLQHHPHVHCVVPGGGPSPDGTRWVAARPCFFLPVRVLSALFRRLFLERLRAAFEADKLRFFGALLDLLQPAVFARRLAAWRRIDWVVYAKRPFGGPAQVLAYLGRYTHRVAIANSRLIQLEEGRVSFRWRDYRQRGKTKVMTLATAEFIRRSSCTPCRMASSASAITACSPMDTAPPKSRSAAGYSPLRLHQHHSRSTIASDIGGSPAIHSTSAQAAAATCNRSVGCLPAIQSAPNGTTRHDPASPIRPPLAPRAHSAFCRQPPRG
jgi:hypothetical protein